MATLFFAGCATTPQTRDAQSDERLSASPYEVIGHVVMVDPDRDLAVIDLESHIRSVSGRLTARNEILRETASLEPTNQQSGRSLGARILSGLPNIGDEVVRQRD